MSLDDDISEIIYESDEIQRRVDELGDTITEDFSDQKILLVGVLRGCIAFISDLMRSIDLAVEIDFLAVGSYGQTSESSGVVRVLKDLDEDIEGRNVLLVEDIVDTGLTLDFLNGYIRSRSPKSLNICSLLNKKECREVEIDVDYIGFDVPDEFLVGYGLDYAQKYRNLPYIGALKQKVIDKNES